MSTFDCYDADLASDVRAHRSASASHQTIWGPYARAHQSMASRRQTCVSHSSLDVKIVAADLALRAGQLVTVAGHVVAEGAAVSSPW
eukprot:2432961-Pyramimonas_sp.AAC.1